MKFTEVIRMVLVIAVILAFFIGMAHLCDGPGGLFMLVFFIILLFILFVHVAWHG